jgi:hypothetical protein
MAEKCVIIYTERIERNKVAWASDLDFIDNVYPQTRPPRALCRLLDEQYDIVATQNALNAHEKINLASSLVNTLGWSYSLTKKSPSSICQWFNHLDVDNKLIILAAFIHVSDMEKKILL